MAYVLVLQCTCAYSAIEIQALRTVFECHPECTCLRARDDFTALTTCTKSARGTLAFQLFIRLFLRGFYHRKAVYAVMAGFKLPRAEPSRHTDYPTNKALNSVSGQSPYTLCPQCHLGVLYLLFMGSARLPLEVYSVQRFISRTRG